MKYLFNLLFDAAGDKSGAAPVVNIPDNKSDIKDDIDLLGTEDDEPDDKEDDDADADADTDDKDDDGDKDDKEEEDKEEEEEELDDEGKPKKKEDEEEEEEEEEQDLVRHSYASIKKVYPELFKKFPGLKQAFFREQEFTKLFPNVDDAQSALEAQENYTAIRESVINGDAETFLTNLKSASPESVASFASNFLGDLHKVDKEIYIEVTTPVIKNVLRQVLASAMEDKDENLAAAAKVTHKAIFGGGYDDINKEVRGARSTKEEDTPERNKFNKERNDFYQTKFNTLRQGVWTEVETSLTREIEKGLDPNNSIKPGLKKMLVEKIFDEVTKKVSADTAHIGRMNQLWDREKRAGYSGQLKDSLKTTYLSRAKALMPAIRAKIRAEAVGQQKSDDKNKGDRLNKNNKDKDIPAGKPAKGGKTVITAKEANRKGMSDMDILNS